MKRLCTIWRGLGGEAELMEAADQVISGLGGVCVGELGGLPGTAANAQGVLLLLQVSSVDIDGGPGPGYLTVTSFVGVVYATNKCKAEHDQLITAMYAAAPRARLKASGTKMALAAYGHF